MEVGRVTGGSAECDFIMDADLHGLHGSLEYLDCCCALDHGTRAFGEQMGLALNHHSAFVFCTSKEQDVWVSIRAFFTFSAG